MTFKSKLMDEAAVNRTLARITHEIIERNKGTENICLVGIRRRGITLAEKLADNMRKFENVSVPVGHIDISLYRDDLSDSAPVSDTAGSHIPVDITNKTVILVDDVIYTGRTCRAAIEAVFSHGRAGAIQLAVLIDRGHRELPIRPDFIGKNIPTSKSEVVCVMVDEYDGTTGVSIYEKDE